MLSSIKDYFRSHSHFTLKEELFYQNGFSTLSHFEEDYVRLRRQEGRLYDDNTVGCLPDLPAGHPLYREWAIRKHTADALIHYLKKKKVNTLMEIGCGNGWMMSYLNQSLAVDCCGIDVNETELKQAIRLFGKNEKLTFVYADIAELILGPLADIIVLASAIQYFPDLTSLLGKLMGFLQAGGEIHILDSPIYTPGAVASAHERSNNYFRDSGNPAMTKFYHHHQWKSFQKFNYQVLHNPAAVWNKWKSWMSPGSPFPWVRVTAS